jgi:DNA-binding NarL/FixJ family response regulator
MASTPFHGYREAADMPMLPSMGPFPHTIFVVEDNELTRQSLVRRITDAGAELKVTTAVGSCREIRAALEVSRPEVLLVDLGLPDGDGLDIIRDATRRWPEVLVMVITVFGDEVRVVSAIKAGAAGYLLKDDPAVSIGAALHQLLAGGSPISPAIARHLIRHFRGDAEQPAAPSAVRLTNREMDVLSLASKGFSYGEIAALLSLTPSTVSSYTKNIYEKLAVSSRSEAVYEATRMGLISRTS